MQKDTKQNIRFEEEWMDELAVLKARVSDDTTMKDLRGEAIAFAVENPEQFKEFRKEL